jgi:GNAT superfamily N-acetyltransferase
MDNDIDQRLPDGLRLRCTTSAQSPLLEHFFEGYDRAFVLPDEREEIEGFRNCLALNRTTPGMFGRYHREVILTLDDEHGALLGGANFLATGMTAVSGPPVSIALNYIFVERAARGRGLARQLVDHVSRMANLYLLGDSQNHEAPAIFIEQNDPLKLSADDYAADTAHTGLDQVDRLDIWARMGARLVDFDYIQPALSDEQESDDGLLYAALHFPGDAVPSLYLHDHLQSFFAVSVLKEGDLEGDQEAMSQLAMLAARQAAVPLLDMRAAIGALRQNAGPNAGRSFRKFVEGLER